MDLAERAACFKFLLRDRDSKFTAAFDDVLAGNSARIIKTSARSPRANSFAKRYVERYGASASTTCCSTVNNSFGRSSPSTRGITTVIGRTSGGNSDLRCMSPAQVIDVTARIKRRQVVHSLINEYRRAP